MRRSGAHLLASTLSRRDCLFSACPGTSSTTAAASPSPCESLSETDRDRKSTKATRKASRVLPSIRVSLTRSAGRSAQRDEETEWVEVEVEAEASTQGHMNFMDGFSHPHPSSSHPSRSCDLVLPCWLCDVYDGQSTLQSTIPLGQSRLSCQAPTLSGIGAAAWPSYE